MLAALALLGCGGGGGGAGSGKVLDAPFQRLDGAGESSFAAYRGRPAVVNFFSSTCVPCVTEMPALERLHQDLGKKVAFVGIDVQDTVEAGRSFIAAVKVTWDIGRDPLGAIPASLGSTGLPTTVVLDRDGRVVWTHLGSVATADVKAALTKNGLLS